MLIGEKVINNFYCLRHCGGSDFVSVILFQRFTTNSVTYAIAALCLHCLHSCYYVSRYMTVYFVWLFCRTVLFMKRAKISISSGTIQNMFSTLVKNLKKEEQVIFCE